MTPDVESFEPAPVPAASTLETTTVRPVISNPVTGFPPVVSVVVRVVQLLLCVIALALIASAKESFVTAVFFDGSYTFATLSFTEYSAFIFQLVMCCFVLIYVLGLLVLASMKLCNLVGGIYSTNIIWWGQVIGDLLLGELLFAAACASATISSLSNLFSFNYGFYGFFTSMARASTAFSFITAISLLASAFVLLYILVRRKL